MCLSHAVLALKRASAGLPIAVTIHLMIAKAQGTSLGTAQAYLTETQHLGEKLAELFRLNVVLHAQKSSLERHSGQTDANSISYSKGRNYLGMLAPLLKLVPDCGVSLGLDVC